MFKMCQQFVNLCRGHPKTKIVVSLPKFLLPTHFCQFFNTLRHISTNCSDTVQNMLKMCQKFVTLCIGHPKAKFLAKPPLSYKDPSIKFHKVHSRIRSLMANFSEKKFAKNLAIKRRQMASRSDSMKIGAP